MISEKIVAVGWPLAWLPLLLATAAGSEILMITLGSTKSHKIPFWELAKGLVQRNHNITLMSAFPSDSHLDGLEEIAPKGLVSYIRDYMSIDMVGSRIRGEEPLPYSDVLRFGFECCEAFLGDYEIKVFLRSGRSYDLVILDGAYPECGLGVAHKLKAPFMYINTIGFYLGSLSMSGTPAPYSVTPTFNLGLTDNMDLLERTYNTLWFMFIYSAHFLIMHILHGVSRKHLGPHVPHPYDLAKNVSFILQNGHYSVSYPRPYLPNVAEVACMHCKKAKMLSPDLEKWISGAGDAGFIYVSMGSSVGTSKIPKSVHRLFMNTLKRLPQRVLWKQDLDGNMTDVPSNIKLYKWLPQQDLLGHPKIKAFVTHAGLCSMLETVYHGVPVISIPVFCDQDVNAAKMEIDGYGKKLELRYLTSEIFYNTIMEVINSPKYKVAVTKIQRLFRDQKESPIERAIYWTEYVLRHEGAYHLQSPAKDLNVLQYYLVDVIVILLTTFITAYLLLSYLLRLVYKYLIDCVRNRRMDKLYCQSRTLLNQSTKLIDHVTIKKKNL